jgi:hypothetical protein
MKSYFDVSTIARTKQWIPCDVITCFAQTVHQTLQTNNVQFLISPLGTSFDPQVRTLSVRDEVIL